MKRGGGDQNILLVALYHALACVSEYILKVALTFLSFF